MDEATEKLISALDPLAICWFEEKRLLEEKKRLLLREKLKRDDKPDAFRDFHNSKFVSFSGEILDPSKDSLVGSFLDAKLGMLGVPASKLIYFRRDCQELYDTLLADIEDIENNPTRLLYLGNPGIGKSLTGIQLLFLLVTLHSTKPTVYYSEEVSRGYYYLFKDGKFQSYLDRDAVDPYLWSSDTFYIHDGSAVESPDSVRAQAVLITSPDRQVYKRFCKASGGYLMFYGRLWTLEELRACWERAYSALPWEIVLEHVRIAGPVPRLVFLKEIRFESVRTIMRNKLAQTSELLALFAMIGGHCTDKSFSHVLLHLDRGDYPFEGFTTFASDYVKEQLLLRLEKEKWVETIGQYKNLASFRGTVMKLLMHMTFPKFLGKCQRIHGPAGGCVAELNVDEAEDLRIIFYMDFDDLQAKIEKCIKEKSAAAYFWPRTENEAAIDSIYIDFKGQRAYLLQSTVSMRHAVVWHPVTLLMKFLGSMKISIVGLFFVVADMNFAAFKAQRWRRTRKVGGDYPEITNIPSLCQYKVEFKIFDDDLKNIEMLSDSMDDEFRQKLKQAGDVPMDHVRKRKRVTASAPEDRMPECKLNSADLDVADEFYEQEDDELH